MELLQNKPILKIFGIGVSVYIIEKIIFITLGINTSSFRISLETIHLIMLLFSVSIMIIINMVFKKNKDVVGMTFLLITSIKVVIIYLIGSYFILGEADKIEKWNFYGLFMIYLGLETFFTGRRLNQTNF